MKRGLRVTALVSTLLMALANLPSAFAASDDDVPPWLQWPATVLGVLGLVAFVVLLTRVDRAPSVVLGVGVANVATSVAVMAAGNSSGVLGLVLGGLAVLSAAGLTAGASLAGAGAERAPSSR